MRDTTRTPNRAAAAGIAAYAATVKTLFKRRIDDLRRYAARAEPLIERDFRERIDRLEGELGASWTADAVGPSLFEAAELPMEDETRHSLVLAWLLDPLRSGPLAVAFWDKLLDLVEVSIRHRRTQQAEFQRLAVIREGLHCGDLERLAVRPRWWGDEFGLPMGLGSADVFVRSDRDGALAWALLVEVKTNITTREQLNQLLRYYKGVSALGGGSAGDAAERTMFVFLTESQREPVTAVESAERWVKLTWHDVAEALGTLADRVELPPWARTFSSHYRDALRRHVLGESSQYELRDRQRRLRLTWREPGPSDPEQCRRRVVALHRSACELERDLAREGNT